MTKETAAKKDTQKLQRAIVDALEDVKAQDLVVFNTEHLSPLFERVIVASGTSNRQTKALAASVRDKVREAGFAKPRIEGEENGEWIIVDCGAAVVHVMQPSIRQYYHLEEIWGDKPVRLKFGAPKPVVFTKSLAKAPAKTAAKTVAKTASKTPAQKAGVKTSGAGRGASAKAATSTAGEAARPAAKRASPKPASTPKPAARKTPSTTPRARPVAQKTAAKKAAG